MQYRTFLKQDTGCPFCADETLDRDVIVTSNRRAMLTVAKAPYVQDQLLVIPKRHVEKISQLRLLETLDCLRLIRWADKKLYQKGGRGYNVLLRDGEGVGKSIPHLHIHLIPDHDILIKNGTDTRRVLSKSEIKNTVKRLHK